MRSPWGLIYVCFLHDILVPGWLPLVVGTLQNRRRTKVTSFCELCSPVLLLCVLVFGYTLSDVLVFPEEVGVLSSLSGTRYTLNGSIHVRCNTACCHHISFAAIDTNIKYRIIRTGTYKVLVLPPQYLVSIKYQYHTTEYNRSTRIVYVVSDST